MKRTALFTSLLVTAALLSFASCSEKKASQNSTAPSVSSSVSQTISKNSEAEKSSAPESSAPESSAAESSAATVSQPESSSEPEQQKIWLTDELLGFLDSKGIDSSSADITEGIEHDYKGVLFTKAELVFSGSTDETAELLEELSALQEGGLYLTSISLSRSYDTFTSILRLENPYANPSGSSDGARKYIREHWGGLDRASLIRAFVDDNMDYSLQSAKGLLFADKNGAVKLEVGIDFRTYDGFVTYKYKMSQSENFSIDGDVSAIKTSAEDTELPLHTDAVLYSDKFNR